jgi:two-component system LytT family sensor kinase|tara:strand:- start:3698 stop:4834 length:1137 start_codon:yes stop_codon:yes gene_type:complete
MVKTNIHPMAQALYHNTSYQFWLLQLVGWLGLAVISFLSLTLWYDQQQLNYIAHILLQSLLGICVSWPLRPLFHYLWNMKPLRRLISTAVGVLACSILWTGLRISTFMAMTDETGLWADFGGWLFGSIFIFSCWAAFYYGVKYYQLLQEEHETLLKSEAENKEEQLKRSKAETVAHEAQLKMLRYQLNPHFLFNTLNAISALVQINEASKANIMIVQLSDFLRYSLDNDPIRRVSLKDELNALKLYLDIEKTRFGDRLQLDFRADPSAENVRIPSLILQPLAENAIKYAIAPMEEGGKITVIARLDEGYLVIEMIDTGPGVDVESTSDSHTGVGLRNTIDRLHEFYAADYTFRLERAGSQGTRVYMRLPLEKQLGALS